MSGLFSASWYRVESLRPRLRSHARISRHVYRGLPWYVLEDLVNSRVHRFTPQTHALIGLMDGERSVGEIWEIACESLGDDAPTQDEMIQLLSQLHATDVLRSDVPPDAAELLERLDLKASQQLRGRLMSPFAVKVPLVDPDEWLRRAAPFVRPLIGWLGGGIWLTVVLPAVFLAGVHFKELSEGVVDRILAPQNLLLIWLLFPVVKILHEIGHGLFARAYGGEVHDMGVMLLVLTPVPYVDASSASAFPEKRRRALVAAGGMLVEVFLAALAFYLWLNAQPGLVRSLAFNTMLIAGVTTLTFNANPLLRFDGYYILADWLEIPNLRQRASAYLAYLVQRYAFGSREVEAPEADSTEKVWLVTYGVAAFLYRFVVIAFIVLFVLDLSLVLGAILASVAAVGWVGLPLVKVLRYVATDGRLRHVRTRAVTLTAGFALALTSLVILVPFPYRTAVEGVVWIPKSSFVRSEGSGFVERVLVVHGQQVVEGEPLVVMSDPDLAAYADVLSARLEGLEVRAQLARTLDRAQAKMLEDEIHHVERRLARARERLEGLILRGTTSGVFVSNALEDLPGRYFEQGDLLGYVLEVDVVRVRAVVGQDEIELVQDRMRSLEVRFAEDVARTHGAELVRVVPAAADTLPSVALGSAGGGSLAADPRDERGAHSVASVFQVDIELPKPRETVAVGGRVYVRFDHGYETLAARWARSLRQLFLSRFDV